MATQSLTVMARAILENVTKLEEYFNTNNLPQPSFEEDALPELSFSPEMQQCRTKAIDLAMELQDLLLGPAMLLRPVLNGTSLHAIYKYDIASKVPLGGQISYKDLAQQVNIDQADLERVLRFAMIYHRLFQEKEPGFVSHTAASRYLSEDKYAKAGLGFMFDECYQSFAHTVEALEHRRDTLPDQSGWAFATKTNKPMWTYHTEHPELGERAALAMTAFTKGFNMDTRALTQGYDWSPFNSKKGLLVDVGGADGHVSVAIARANPQLRCIVQEIPEVVAKAQYQVPDDVRERVQFQTHDFFQPQEEVADAYLFRQIFHNWGDAQCVQMLRALIPSLRPGARVIANDLIVPPPGVLPPTPERAVRGMDMIMMSLFNSRERQKRDWEMLFAEADPRFRDVKVWQPEGSQLGLVEATWTE